MLDTASSIHSESAYQDYLNDGGDAGKKARTCHRPVVRLILFLDGSVPMVNVMSLSTTRSVSNPPRILRRLAQITAAMTTSEAAPMVRVAVICHLNRAVSATSQRPDLNKVATFAMLNV